MKTIFPIAKHIGSSMAIVLGYTIYGADKTPPKFVHWLHHRLVNTKRAIMQLRYRYDSRHRYHIIDTGLPPGYYDPDRLMLHACMKLLCQYVEGRYGSEDQLAAHINDMRATPDPNAPDGLVESCADLDDEALTIYRWWKYDRPENQKEYVRLVRQRYDKDLEETGKVTFEQTNSYREKLEKDDQDMLHRLINIRTGLWV